MNRYTFTTKNGKAYYWNSIPGFIKDNSDSIIGQLVRYSFEVGKEQTDAWERQVRELQVRLEASRIEGDIIFEYDIVRLGKRIDVVLLIRHMVFSLEFKNGKKVFEAKDAMQAEDYATDIKNFHKESEDLYVCPILIATDAPAYSKPQSRGHYPDKQVFLQRENIDTLIPKVLELTGVYGSDDKLDFDTWFNSPYHPTPTIIAAAVEAYTSHDISQIAKSEAGQANVDECEKQIQKVIDYARESRKKCVCFVTGVPGAGKTLVGLDIVAKNLKKGEENLSVYLSGNGPLVEVLRAALVQSTTKKGQKKKETAAAVGTLIQSSLAFKKDNAVKKAPTAEHVLIFDEAQRVWSESQMKRKHQGDPSMAVSEAKLLFQIMDRHKDWAVIVSLIGLGQDIHDGEAGINEWFRCVVSDFKEWELFYSPKVFSQSADLVIDKELIENCDRCHKVDGLHLPTSIRSFRSEKQSAFVDAVLNNDVAGAKELFGAISDKYPVFITRDLKKAKAWVRGQIRGTQRCGLLACSSAQRLKPEGVFVQKIADVPNWFLAPGDDIRSSNMLEIAGREFEVQGLEVDWAVVCWDQDLRRLNKNEWDYYNFSGTRWNKRKQTERQRYLLNSYRVLLTRARQGMVIFVPLGVPKEEDATRDEKRYEEIYRYLLSCGIKELP